MKFIKYVLIWLCIVFVLGLVAGYVYVRLEGKHLFEQHLSKFFGQPAEIEEIRYLVPFGIRFVNFKIQNVLEAEDVRLHLRIPFLLDGRFLIASLEMTRPVFHFVRHDRKALDFGGVYLKKQEAQFTANPQAGAGQVLRGFQIDFLSVSDGRLEILDLAVEEPVKYDAASVTGKAMSIIYPLENQNIKFDLQGVIVNSGEQTLLRGAKFNASGWINWPARSLQAALDISGKAGFSGKMKLNGADNLVKVTGYLDAAPVPVSGEGTVPAEETEGSEQGLEQVVLGFLKAAESRMGMNFSFETKMDEFTLGAVDFEGQWYLPDQKKDLAEILNPAALLGVAPAVVDKAE